MAFTGMPTEVQYTFVDRENTRATTSLFLPNPGADFADAASIYDKALEIGTAIAGLSLSTLVSVNVIFSGRDSAAVGAGEVERKGVFTFATDGGTDYTTGVPGFKDGLLDADRRTIVITTGNMTTEVQAFVDAMLNGPIGANNSATNAAGKSLVRVIEAHKEHGGSLLERRGRSG
jgi:hypothetical protein